MGKMNEVYDLVDDMQYIQDLLDNEETEVSDECLADTFEGLQLEFDDKINGFCKIIKNYSAAEKALDEEIKRLQKKKKSKTKAIQFLKGFIGSVMYKTNKDKIKTAMFSIYGLKNDKLDVYGEVPDEFRRERTTKENDTAAIRAALESGRELDFAKFINSVTIR